MTGSFLGNVIAVFYFLFFQLCGWGMACSLMGREETGLRLLTGSVLGSVLLQWLPVLFAFLMGFTRPAHLWAAAVAGMLWVGLWLLRGRPRMPGLHLQKPSRKNFPRGAFVTLPVFLLFAILVTGSLTFRDGIVYSSQATYGDTSMHLGFITSIAWQGAFPPEYSILPGYRLSYPFLSDSISSSLYLWGAGLLLSYRLPMYFAGAQVMGGFWLLMRSWLGSRKKTALAFLLFFLCGGFGFAYFLSGTEADPSGFTRIFTAFYETPTNYVEENIRWVNMIVDMLVPQRATLFGYAVLMLTLRLLYDAVWRGKSRFFPLVGLLAGALPMIHTHSLVALALVSGVWLLVWMAREGGLPHLSRGIKLGFLGVLILMQVLQIFCTERETDGYLYLLLGFVGVFALFFLWVLLGYVKKQGIKPLLGTWGVYLAITLVLALPQLLIWTLTQATGEGFIRGYFNWANVDDNYIWFYIKNLGIPLLFFVPGLVAAREDDTLVISPVLIIWLTAELAVFQPNVYDNNKLLYVAFIFLCGLSASYMVELYEKLKSTPGTRVLAAMALFLGTISALLTMGREFVAEYELMGTAHVQAAQYISDHTRPEDTILTDRRHNNSVAALTGRNIVCGSPAYLYFHGLPYGQAEQDQQLMFEAPEENLHLFAAYSVDYIMVSDYEKASYQVDEAAMEALFPCVYQQGSIKIFAVNEIYS